MANEKTIKLLKNGVWIYFILLIFEGALRKWVLPSLANPLLIVRDPVALYLLFKAIYNGVWKPNNYVIITIFLTILGFITAMLTGHGSVLVAAYGARITLIHFPLIFLIGEIFDKNDVIKIGKVTLWLTIIMTLLVAVQFYSPQTAWINRGVGGDMTGSGFSGSGDYFRVPGTFSFTNGLANFYSFAAVFVIYFWVNIKEIASSKKLLLIATIALFAAVPLSISRSVLFGIVLSLAFLIVVSTKKPKFILQIFAGIIISMVLFSFLSTFSFFQTASGAFTDRFTSANETEGGLEGVFIDRFLGGMFSALSNEQSSFFGLGLGMGTNAGAKLLTGNTTFLISEGEWGRLIGEMGFVLGLAMIIVRFSLGLDLMQKSWNSVSKDNIMPWMLSSFGLLTIMQGQWAQPTSLGFSVLTGGLIYGALNLKKEVV
jgi:hypothetical protein